MENRDCAGDYQAFTGSKGSPLKQMAISIAKLWELSVDP